MGLLNANGFMQKFVTAILTFQSQRIPIIGDQFVREVPPSDNVSWLFWAHDLGSDIVL